MSPKLDVDIIRHSWDYMEVQGWDQKVSVCVCACMYVFVCACVVTRHISKHGDRFSDT